jgi:hypothetical protein
MAAMGGQALQQGGPGYGFVQGPASDLKVRGS